MIDWYTVHTPICIKVVIVEKLHSQLEIEKKQGNVNFINKSVVVKISFIVVANI